MTIRTLLCASIVVASVLFPLGMAAGGCASGEAPSDPTAEPSPPSATASDSTVTGTGTIDYIDLEGGFYAIVADSGEQYDPGTTLPEDFHQDGLRVRFEVTLRPGAITTRQWGTRVVVESVEEM